MPVYVSGVFDLFHIGHLNFLERAKELGDTLIVGVVTDEFVMTYKGNPIIPFEQRRQIVSGLKCVDHVVARELFTDYKIIEAYDVDLWVVGPEYRKFQGQRKAHGELIEKGVEYVVLPRTPDISTTKIKEDCCEKLIRSGVCPCVTCGRLPGS